MSEVHHSGSGNGISRRHLLAGSAALGATWAAPSIVRLDRAAAGTGSCVSSTVNWSSGFYTGGGSGVVLNGTSGTLSIAATVTANLTGVTAQAGFSGSSFYLAMSGHSIGDNYSVAFSYSDSAGGTICTVSTLVSDIDRNGQGLGCATNSRFEDNIDSIVGPGLTATRFGNLIETPTGNYVSALNCKTNNTENLGLSWTSLTSVGATGFRWVAGTPPGTSVGPDYQLVYIAPLTLCVVPAAASAIAPGSSSFSGRAVPMIRGGGARSSNFTVLDDELDVGYD